MTGLTTNTAEPAHPLGDDFISTEELIRRHDARPVGSVTDLAAAEDPFESDEEFDDFLTDLYATRRADIV